MSTNGRPRPPAPIAVAVEFGEPLAGLAATVDLTSFSSLVEADLGILAARLGVQGRISVESSFGSSRRPLRLKVNGRVLPYPPGLVRRAWVAAAPKGLRDLATVQADAPELGFPGEWLSSYARSDERDPEVLLGFAARLVHAIVLERPSSLLGRSQLLKYADEADLGEAQLRPILGPLLDLGASIADRDLIVEIVREGIAIGRPVEDTLEAVFTHVRSHVVEIQVHPDSLAELLEIDKVEGRFSVYSSRVTDERQALFRDLERTFFSQYGFLLPRLDWVPTTSMEHGMLSVRFDGWSSLPMPLVRRGERLVMPRALLDREDSVLGGEGEPALHPLSASRCLVVKASKESLEAMGIPSWGPIDFVVLNVFAALAGRLGRLLGIEEVEYQLARLRYQRATFGGGGTDAIVGGPYQELVHAVLGSYSLGDLTRVLRAFVDEGLSVRSLPEILSHLLHYETVPMDRDGLVLLDDRLPVSNGTPGWTPAGRFYEFTRKQLKSYLSFRHTWSENTLVAYVLEPELEARVTRLAAEARGARAPSHACVDEIERLRDAVWTVLHLAAPAPAGQVILTTSAARPAVRALLAAELPEVPVVSYAELRSDVNVHVVARISVEESSPSPRAANA